MPRLNTIESAEQEGLETIQACLGNALVYLKLIELRIRQAAARQSNLLDPAIDDLGSACTLIQRAQSSAGSLTPTASRARSNR